jgi:hypothetical protein
MPGAPRSGQVTLELKTSKAGKPFAVANVAVGSGDDTTWIRVIAFGSFAERAAAELTKGDACYTDLRLERWTTTDGQERTGLAACAIGRRTAVEAASLLVKP